MDYIQDKTEENEVEAMKEKRKSKSPATPEKIYKIMLYMTFGVGGAFFLKNVLGGAIGGAVVVGVCLLVFAGINVVMRKLNVAREKQQLALSLCLVLLVFIISMNSGNYYSDDFPLFLAVIALSGMYLEPRYPIYQGILASILLLVLYAIHPEKADPISQYLMCLGIFAITSFVLYMLIKRGRAFIEIGTERAEQAERLISSMKRVGGELDANCEQSSKRIAGMEEVNDTLAGNVSELKRGSEEISSGTREVSATCSEAMEQVQITEQKVEGLNEEIRKVEEALDENRTNMQTMAEQMEMVRSEVREVNAVFALLQDKIEEISGVTEQLTKIASSTKMLALNASIEAARAGASGAGFAVVASKVQTLALDSSNCSDHVTEIVDQMKEQIADTSRELEDSISAIEGSLETLSGLERG